VRRILPRGIYKLLLESIKALNCLIEEMRFKSTKPDSRPIAASHAYHEKLAWWHTTWAVRASRFLLFIVFSIEAVIFYRTMILELAPNFPRNFDQTSYYLDAYLLITKAQKEGWHIFLQDLIYPRSATGNGFTLQGAVLGFIFGPSRTVIISLNLIYFFTLQLTVFEVIQERTRSLALAWIAISLLLSAPALFNVAGGIFDYRSDFSALCLYGIWTSLLVWSRTFHYAKRTLAIVAVGVLLISMRFITVFYVAGVLGGLAIYFLVAVKRHSSLSERELALRRFKNVVICGIATAALVLPLLILSWPQIYGYYVVGHVLGEEKYIVAHGMGLHTFRDHILYYPQSILSNHIAGLTLDIMIALAIISVASAICYDHITLQELAARLRAFRLDLLALGLAIFIPVAVLTADISKSPVVGGIVVVPIILIVILLCAALRSNSDRLIFQAVSFAQGSARTPLFISRPMAMLMTHKGLPLMWKVAAIRIAAIVRRFAMFSSKLLGRVSVGSLWSVGAGGVVLLAMLAFANRGLATRIDIPQADLERINQISAAIGHYITENSLMQPRVSFDRVADFLNWATLTLWVYEHQHRFVHFDPLFGHPAYGIFATPREDALSLFAASDIIVLTDPVKGREAPYPMNTKIREYWDELRDWTVQNRIVLFSTSVLNIPHEVYVRRPMGSKSSPSSIVGPAAR
jgi:hypothetical protein